MSRLAGIFTVIPISFLLSISFFVLFAVRKVETQGLRAFAFVVAAVLWFASLAVFSAGIYILSTGRMPLRGMACPCAKMQMMKQCGNMPAMMQSGMDSPVTKR